MSGKFKLIKTTDLVKLTEEDRLSESDLSFVVDNKLLQFEYQTEGDLMSSIELKPGVFSIQITPSGSFNLEPSMFVNDDIMEQFVHVENIDNKINCFFKNLDKYKKFGIEVPKRAALLFGPAGSGKSTVINKVIRKYNEDGETTILIWNTDQITAGDVKRFFKYTDCSKVKKMILVAEDIGGIEMDQVRVKSEPSLLALLDNKEKSFKIPIFILATTNHPEIFMGNLTNRPDRFDDKIEMSFPTKEMRLSLYEFFKKDKLSEEESKLLSDKKSEKLTPSHLREIVIRSAIYDKTTIDVINEINAEIEYYEKNFTKTNKLGF